MVDGSDLMKFVNTRSGQAVIMLVSFLRLSTDGKTMSLFALVDIVFIIIAYYSLKEMFFKKYPPTE